MTASSALEMVAWTLAGGVLGAVYLYLIGRSVAALTAGAGGATIALAVLARLGLAAAAFWLAATQGALQLGVMLAGFTLVRIVVLRRKRAE